MVGKPRQILPEKIATEFAVVVLLGQRLRALSRTKNGLVAALFDGQRLSFFYLVEDLVLSKIVFKASWTCKRTSERIPLSSSKAGAAFTFAVFPTMSWPVQPKTQTAPSRTESMPEQSMLELETGRRRKCAAQT